MLESVGVEETVKCLQRGPTEMPKHSEKIKQPSPSYIGAGEVGREENKGGGPGGKARKRPGRVYKGSPSDPTAH